MTQTTIRTAIVDAALADVSKNVDDEVSRALSEVVLVATEAAARNREPLLDFDEFNDVDL